MAITISGENNNDRILASDGVLDSISGINAVGVVTATSFTGDLIGDVTGNLTGNVTGNINNTTLLLQTGGTERVRITSDGKIGIAESSPEFKLTVYDAGYSGVTIKSNRNSATDNIGGLHFKTRTTNVAYIQSLVDGTIKFRNTSSLTERLRINSSGNVRLGGTSDTTDQGYRLTLQGSSNATYLQFFDNGTGTTHGSDGSYIGLANQDFYVWNREAKDIVFASSNNERLRITSTGYVQTKSELWVGGSAPVLRWRDSTHGEKATARIDGNDLYFEVANSERLRITSGGKVNIGTGNLTQTDRMLNVYGGRMRIEGISSGNNFEIMSSASAGQSNGILCQAGTNSSDINATFRNTSGATLFRIRGDGRIGINESSPDTKLHVKDGMLKIETETTFYSGSGENGENYPSIFLNANHTIGNNPAHAKITVRHSGQNSYSGDIVLMPRGFYGGSYGYQDVLRISAYKRVGINESAPAAELDVKGDGVPVIINSSNSNANKIAFEDNGTTKSYIGGGSGTALIVSDNSANMLFQITTNGVAYNGNTSTHGSGVFMCEIHTDLLRLLKASQNHPNTTGNYYSWSDGGTASWTWDHYGMRMDANVGSHTWQCGSVYLTPGFYTLMQCYKPEPNTHGWSVFGSNSNANRYSLTSNNNYGSYNTYLISDTDQHASNNGRARWFGTTQGNFWHQVTSADTYRIQQMGQPYGGGGYKYYVLAAYLLKLK